MSILLVITFLAILYGAVLFVPVVYHETVEKMFDEVCDNPQPNKKRGRGRPRKEK